MFVIGLLLVQLSICEGRPGAKVTKLNDGTLDAGCSSALSKSEDSSASLIQGALVGMHRVQLQEDRKATGSVARAHRAHKARTARDEFEQDFSGRVSLFLATKASQANVNRQILVGLLGCLGIFFLYIFWASRFVGVEKNDYQEEVEVRSPEPLQEDAYGFAICSLVRDSQKIASGEGALMLRAARITTALGLIYASILCQLGLVLQVQWFVTPQAVSNIRNDYSVYEYTMYEGNTTLTEHGKHRGVDGFFNPNMFATLDPLVVKAVCSIPLSQLSFLMLVLFIWSLTCIAQIKSAIEMLLVLIYTTPTIDSMSDSVGVAAYQDQDVPEGVDTSAADADADVDIVIKGLTVGAKIWITMTILLPWLGNTLFLMILGNRWLTATNDFGSLVGNAVALEFILLLKDLSYNALVPERCKREVRNTKMLPPVRFEVAGCFVYFSTFAWGIVTVAWVLTYIFKVQSVLPGYKWDVHEPCSSYLSSLGDHGDSIF